MPTLSSSASARACASRLSSFSTWIGASMTFSSTVMWDHRLKLWNTMPSSARMRSTCRRSSGMAWPLRRRTHADDFAADRDAPGIRRLQQVDAAQERALARAAGADHGDHVADMRGQRHAFQHLELAEPLVQVFNDKGGGCVPHRSLDSSLFRGTPCRGQGSRASPALPSGKRPPGQGLRHRVGTPEQSRVISIP